MSLQPQFVPVPERKTATGSFVCSLLGLLFGAVPLTCFVAFPLAVIGLCLGVGAVRTTPRPRLAKAGTVLGALGVLLSCLGFVIVVSVFSGS